MNAFNNLYVITKNSKILHKLRDFETDDTVKNVENLYASCKVNYNHSENNPVCLEYWPKGSAINSRVLSPSYMRGELNNAQSN